MDTKYSVLNLVQLCVHWYCTSILNLVMVRTGWYLVLNLVRWLHVNFSRNIEYVYDKCVDREGFRSVFTGYINVFHTL
jgi:hypothetical protein